MEFVEHLKKIPLFANVRAETLERLATIAKREDYYPSEEIVAQGELAKRFFVVDRGIVNLRETLMDGSERSVGIVTSMIIAGLNTETKSYFGEQMFTSQEPYDYHATAVDNVQVYYIERGDFDALLLQDPQLRDELVFLRDEEIKRTRGYEWVIEGERVILVAHKHWYVLLPGILQVLVLAIGVLVFNVILRFLLLDQLTLLGLAAGLIPIGWALFQVYDWLNDDYIVTTQRVAHVERVYLLTRELREGMPIDKIVAVVVKSEGLRRYLGAATVVIQSAGRTDGSVTFADISRTHAKQVRQAIQQQQDKLTARMAAQQRERDRLRIQQVLREYMLPHVVAQERAAEYASRTAPVISSPPTIGQRIQRIIASWLDLEYRSGSVITWRKHWIVLFKQARRWILALIGLDIVFIFVALNPTMSFAHSGGYVLGGLAALIICLGGLLWEWEDWRNDTYAVTDTQIIDAERLPLGLNERSTTASLDQIQDVKVHVPSFWANVLNYGDVRIETAGAGGGMIFYSIHNPRAASDEIFRRIQEHRKRKEERESHMRNRGVIDALIGYDRLRKEEANWAEERRKAEAAAAQAQAAPPEPATDTPDQPAAEQPIVPRYPKEDNEQADQESAA